MTAGYHGLKKAFFLIVGIPVFITLAMGCYGKDGKKTGAAAGKNGTAGKDKNGKSEKALKDSALLVKEVQASLPEQSPLKVRWALDLGKKKVDKIWDAPEGSKAGIFLIQTTDNDLVAIDRRSGITKWWTVLTDKILDKPTITEFSIYFVEKGKLVCLELHSGEVVWSLRLPFPPSGAPAIIENDKGNPIIYLSGLDRRVYGLELVKKLWPPENSGSVKVTRKDITIIRREFRERWHYFAYGQLSPAIHYNKGSVITSDWQGNVYGIDIRSTNSGKPEKVWRFRARGAITGDTVINGASLYIPSQDQNLYCTSNRDGSMIWRYSASDRIDKGVQVVEDELGKRTSVFVKEGKTGPYTCLDAGNGNVNWDTKKGEEIVAVNFDMENDPMKRCIVTMRNSDSTLSAHYLGSGEQLWQIPAGQFGAYATNCSKPLTVATFGSYICALEYDF